MKNSQSIALNKKTGARFVAQSAAFKTYAKACAALIPPEYRFNLSVPLNVKTVFHMPDHRKCDLSNLIGAIHDILKHNNVIADDEYRIIHSVDGSCVVVDPDRVGVDVTIEIIEGIVYPPRKQRKPKKSKKARAA